VRVRLNIPLLKFELRNNILMSLILRRFGKPPIECKELLPCNITYHIGIIRIDGDISSMPHVKGFGNVPIIGAVQIACHILRVA